MSHYKHETAVGEGRGAIPCTTKSKAWFETVAYKRNVYELKMHISHVVLLKASISISVLV